MNYRLKNTSSAPADKIRFGKQVGPFAVLKTRLENSAAVIALRLLGTAAVSLS
jgi:hypothetical protein